MADSISFENYVARWAPVMLDKFFFDVLKSDPRVSEFQPSEIAPPRRSLETKISDVAGAISLALTGFGWQSRTKPVQILSFHGHPPFYATFINDRPTMKAKFLFPIPLDSDPKKWGEIKIYGKTSGGFFGTKNLDDVGVRAWLSDRVPGLENVNADSKLKDLLFAIFKMDLIFPHIITVKYEKKGNLPLGIVEYEVRNEHKKWQNAITEFSLKPQDFVVDVFNATNSIICHVQTYFQKPSAFHEIKKRCPDCGSETHTDYCPSCGKRIQS
ncbi:MAG: hypothetical protein QXX08_07895 [Candidatus Bathyarchaeia archaeon]